MIVEFQTEFERIALAINAAFESKKISELEDFVQGYVFDEPLINLVPISSFKTSIGASSQIVYNGTCKIQFLTKAVKSDNFERTKDVLIDQMIILASKFFRNLNLNENQIFGAPQWTMENEILRQYTSNFLVGIESTIIFSTSCARS